MPGRAFFWADLRTTEFAALDPEKTIAILPVAAIEQHGPHLPVMTDSAISDGMLALVKTRLPPELTVLVLPLQAIGKSNEHLLSPGTLTVTAETLTRLLVEIGESVHRAGLRKLVLANAHGGNTQVLGIVARDLRVRLGMLVVATSWGRFGLPENVFDPVETRFGIHAGDLETSLMLQFRPELVSMADAKNFVSSDIAMAREYTHLAADGVHGFAWMAQDLHPEGAAGDASKATAEKGLKTAEHQVAGFIALLRDISAFPLSRLYSADAGKIR